MTNKPKWSSMDIDKSIEVGFDHFEARGIVEVTSDEGG